MKLRGHFLQQLVNVALELLRFVGLLQECDFGILSESVIFRLFVVSACQKNAEIRCFQVQFLSEIPAGDSVRHNDVGNDHRDFVTNFRP